MTRLVRMDEHMMTSFGATEGPTVSLKQLDQVFAIYGGYYTHLNVRFQSKTKKMAHMSSQNSHGQLELLLNIRAMLYRFGLLMHTYFGLPPCLSVVCRLLLSYD